MSIYTWYYVLYWALLNIFCTYCCLHYTSNWYQLGVYYATSSWYQVYIVTPPPWQCKNMHLFGDDLLFFFALTLVVYSLHYLIVTFDM